MPFVLGDDFLYALKFPKEGFVGSTGIESMQDYFNSQINHYNNYNNRIAPHALLQIILLLPTFVFDLTNVIVFLAPPWFIIKPFRVSDSGDQTLVDYEYELKHANSNEFRSESKKRNIRSREGIESLKNDITLFNTMIENELNGRATWVNKMNFGGEHETKSVMKQTNEKTNDMNELNENDMERDGIVNNVQDILSDYKMGIITSTEELQETINKMFDANYHGVHEARGLGHGVKNSGDRNLKKSKDNSHAPVTTLPEGRTFDEKIKNLSEGSVKKKDLINFINEQARKLANDIKEEGK